MKKIFIIIMVILPPALVGGGSLIYRQLTTSRQQFQNNLPILDTNQRGQKNISDQNVTRQNSTSTPSSATTSTSRTPPTGYNPDTQTPKESTGTISSLIKKEDDNQKCTFTSSLPNPYDGNKIYTYTGGVYISGEKIRIDHNNALPQINGVSTESHTIFDGEYSFAWSKNFQLKVDIRKFFPSVSRKVDNEKLLDPVDLTRIYKFVCKPLSPDEKGLFSPPANIVFQELSK